MFAVAAGLWLTVAAAPAASVAHSPKAPCPVTKVAFAPPLDQPMRLTRDITRTLATGEFRQTVTYQVYFTRAGRGYRMRWQQTAQSADGPPELLRLLALQEDSAEGETLDFALDASGALLGVTEADDAADRLAKALDRLRKDPALASRPLREQAIIAQMLDRIAALQPAERADLLLAKAARLLVAAGRGCTGDTITGHDGAPYSVVQAANADGNMALESITHDQRADGSTLIVSTQLTVSPDSGLALLNWRSMHSTAGGVSRYSQDRLQLAREP